ncbi:hypothetical protein SH601_05505 [Gracilibacillus sp. S3-1-1]|uniref:Uncharacterized protein n=1 Tax=Gracilibacillus pellucidus TaxID=3095368 RepID=A0ACC6M3B6_9BACI|nr:hypothetical protein [Gracilibacillus sp. S3-1-1]MDX8045441.1 hypothetical protein [Gracilibacillus sp. S3-1-1]
MSIESRLKRLEKKYLKNSAYIRGMKIMEQINNAHEIDDRKTIPDLLIKLHKNGRKTA